MVDLKVTFQKALSYHDPELLQAVFDAGYRHPAIPEDEDDRGIHQGQLWNDLGWKKSPFQDYLRFEKIINLLIQNGALGLKQNQTIQDFILRFTPQEEAMLNLLESPQGDLNLAIEIGKKAGLVQSMTALIRTADLSLQSNISRGLQACEVLRDRYKDLDQDVKDALLKCLKKCLRVNKNYFDGLDPVFLELYI
jgi:hypothetical protein